MINFIVVLLFLKEVFLQATTTILDAVLNVFTSIGNWIPNAVNQLVPMFYAEGSLTFLGVLAVAGLAFSVVFLVMGIIQNFLHFRG